VFSTKIARMKMPMAMSAAMNFPGIETFAGFS
jgi:hypothetical protein